ncbi:hypothetical protein D3C81_2070300 [compost metagenome]
MTVVDICIKPCTLVKQAALAFDARFAVTCWKLLRGKVRRDTNNRETGRPQLDFGCAVAETIDALMFAVKSFGNGMNVGIDII